MKLNDQRLTFSGASIQAIPFPHFGGLGIMNNNADLYQWLNCTKEWSLTEETFYTQYEFSLLDAAIPPSLQWLTGSSAVDCIKACLTKQFSVQSIDLVGITAHQLNEGHKIGIHNDFVEGEETHRLIIQINPDWTDDNGGYLMLFNSENSADIAKVIKPINNSFFGFEISQKSFHAVSTVRNYSRYTLVYTFKAV